MSLDFELYWGVRDVRTLESYRENLEGVRLAVPKILSLFTQYQIHATWAIVGFLFHTDASEARHSMPKLLPSYADTSLNPFNDFVDNQLVGHELPCRFAPDLCRAISRTPHQELGTHTYSHYYCLEAGQTAAEFEADLEAAKMVMAKFGANPISLVFPRNQFNENYLKVCEKVGIRSYRGNPASWLYEARNENRESTIRRALRLVDAYLKISDDGWITRDTIPSSGLTNVPASRFLRPHSPHLRWLEPLHRRRIVNEMTRAAEGGGLYHLWFHPHNFGQNIEANLTNLEIILKSFQRLREQGKMISLGMAEVADHWRRPA